MAKLGQFLSACTNKRLGFKWLEVKLVLMTVVKGLQDRIPNPQLYKLLNNLGQFLSLMTNIRLGLKCLAEKFVLTTVVKILLHWPPNPQLYKTFLANLGQFLSVSTNIRLGLKWLAEKLLSNWCCKTFYGMGLQTRNFTKLFKD